MKIFLWAILVNSFIIVLEKFSYLGRAQYPRIVKHRAWEDCVDLIFEAIFGIWAIVLLSQI